MLVRGGTPPAAPIRPKSLPRIPPIGYPQGRTATSSGHRRLGRSWLARITALRYTRLTDDGLRNLASLRRLEKLALDRTRVTDAGLEHLEGLGQLHSLYLRETAVRGPGLRGL